MTYTFRHIALAAALIPGSLGALQSSEAQTRYVPSYTSQTQYVQAQPRQKQAKISYAQAKSIALSRHPGAKYQGMDLQGNTYVVRLEVSKGRVIDVRVDAVTGRAR